MQPATTEADVRSFYAINRVNRPGTLVVAKVLEACTRIPELNTIIHYNGELSTLPFHSGESGDEVENIMNAARAIKHPAAMEYFKRKEVVAPVKKTWTFYIPVVMYLIFMLMVWGVIAACLIRAGFVVLGWVFEYICKPYIWLIVSILT
jgi:hypothetical protein